MNITNSRFFSLAAAVLAILVTVSAAAQTSGKVGSEPTSPSMQQTAPVVIDGEVLFRVIGVSSYPAAVRAKAVSERIGAIAANRSVDPGTIAISPHPLGLRIAAGGRLIMVVVDADAELEGLKLDQLAELLKIRIGAAVKTYRQERDPGFVRRGIIHAVTAFVLTALAVAGFLLGTHWLLLIIDRRYKRRIQEVKIQSFRLIRSEQIYAVLKAIIQVLRTIVVVILVYVAVYYVLDLFPWSRLVAARMVEVLIVPLRIVLSSILDTIPDLVFIAIVVILARFVLRLTFLFFRAVERGAVRSANFEPEWALPTYKVVRLGIVAFALVIAYPYIPGSDTAAFKGVSIFAGVVLSLGSSSVISNMIAGYTMIYRKAFGIGDWIKVGTTVGEVIERRLLVTQLKSPKNEAIVVPNSQVMNMEIVNFSELAKDNGLVLHTTVGIGYEVPWRQVEAMLIEAANRTEGLLSGHTPFVREVSLGDFAVTYELNVYCDDPRRMAALYAHLHRNILDVFNENGVQIMTPHYEGDPETPKLALNEGDYASPVNSSSKIATIEK